MRGPTIPWRMFRTLLKLRYQLLWAQARSSTGKASLFAALYIFGILVFLFFALGGFSAAFAAVRLGRAVQLARGMLAGLLVVGVVAGLVSGAGPRVAFSDIVLRRYPITSRERLAVRHMIGLLDPIWPLLLAMTAGLAAGFAIGNPWRLPIGLPAAALYVAHAYLITVAILSLVDRLLQHKAGPAILGSAVALLMVAVVLVQSLLLRSQNRGWLETLDRILRFLPPGAAASLIAGAKSAEILLAACALAGWILLPALVLYLVEKRPPVPVRERPGAIAWGNPVDKTAGWFGPGFGPLVAKWLRTYLRSVQVRFGLAAAIPFAVGLPWVLPGRAHDKVYLMTLSLFFAMGAVSTSYGSMNMFGLDGQGIRRYSILPVPFKRVHRAGSIAAMLLGAILIPPALIASLAFTNIPLDGRLILMPILIGVAGIFYFNALGLWTTVLTPFPVDPRTIIGNHPPASYVLLQVALFQPAVIPMLYLQGSGSAALVRDHWWLLGAAVVIFAALYAVSLFFTGRTLLVRRERLISAIAIARK